MSLSRGSGLLHYHPSCLSWSQIDPVINLARQLRYDRKMESLNEQILSQSLPRRRGLRKPPAANLTPLLRISLALLIPIGLLLNVSWDNDTRAPGPVKLIVLPEHEDWLLALSAPVAARLTKTQDEPPPLLLVRSQVPSPDTELILDRIQTGSVLLLSVKHRHESSFEFGNRHQEHLRLDPDPLKGSLRIAKHFWGTSDTVITASTRDPSCVILAATLAAHDKIPLLLTTGTPRDTCRLEDALLRLEATTLIEVNSHGRRGILAGHEWAGSATWIDPKEAAKRLARHPRVRRSGTLILSRQPDSSGTYGRLSWLAPYWSLTRRAPVLLSAREDPHYAELLVWDHLQHHGLQPRTLTILASYISIGMKTISLTPPPQVPDYSYSFPVEPCAMPPEGRAASLGIGRIACSSAVEASGILAKSLLWEQRESPPGTVMIANPAHEYAPLPLCETVSRASVQELRNRNVPIREFYRTRTDREDVITASSNAGLIIFEGHRTDNALFREIPQETPPDWIPNYAHEAPFEEDDLPIYFSETDDFAPPENDPHLDHEHLLSRDSPSFDPPEDLIQESTQTWDGTLEEDEYETTHLMQPLPKPPPLNGLPVVILQSCNSLEEQTISNAFSRGATATIGSVTSIHSASGSAFIKALLDGSLYRGDTIGEALRDARNYFLCLMDLKDRRGHTQQSKGMRVAFSFRLWGDPELRLFPHNLDPAFCKPVTGRWKKDGSIKVCVPADRLAESRTELYVASFSPGALAAGILRRADYGAARFLMPFYFFRLPVNKDRALPESGSLRRPNGKSNRAVFRTDPMGRYLYALYFPSREKPGKAFTLRIEN